VGSYLAPTRLVAAKRRLRSKTVEVERGQRQYKGWSQKAQPEVLEELR